MKKGCRYKKATSALIVDDDQFMCKNAFFNIFVKFVSYMCKNAFYINLLNIT